MGYIVLMVVLGLVAFVLVLGRRVLPREMVLAAAGVVVIMGVITLASAVHQVPAGHIGVTYEFGAIVGQTGDGLQFVS